MRVAEYIVEKFGGELVALYILTLGVVLSFFNQTAALGHDLVAAGLMGIKLSFPTGNGNKQV